MVRFNGWVGIDSLCEEFDNNYDYARSTYPAKTSSSDGIIDDYYQLIGN